MITNLKKEQGSDMFSPQNQVQWVAAVEVPTFCPILESRFVASNRPVLGVFDGSSFSLWHSHIMYCLY